MTGNRPGPKPLVDERRFVPSSPEQAAQLREALELVGADRGVRHRVVHWLEECGFAPRLADYRSDATRSNYRKWLAKLGEPPWGGDYDAPVTSKRFTPGYINPARRPAAA